MSLERRIIDPRMVIKPKYIVERLKLPFIEAPEELANRVRRLDVDFASIGESQQSSLIKKDMNK